ncbi:hypothetical protein [Duncaniella dubosii]|uniref:hypothetical protein n=1 Tax=Duncaniella dubosii TaxID=2518971 RepID=UPI003F668F89
MKWTHKSTIQRDISTERTLPIEETSGMSQSNAMHANAWAEKPSSLYASVIRAIVHLPMTT